MPVFVPQDYICSRKNCVFVRARIVSYAKTCLTHILKNGQISKFLQQISMFQNSHNFKKLKDSKTLLSTRNFTLYLKVGNVMFLFIFKLRDVIQSFRTLFLMQVVSMNTSNPTKTRTAYRNYENNFSQSPVDLFWLSRILPRFNLFLYYTWMAVYSVATFISRENCLCGCDGMCAKHPRPKILNIQPHSFLHARSQSLLSSVAP